MMKTVRDSGWSAAGHMLADVTMARLRSQFRAMGDAARYRLARRLIDQAFARYRKSKALPIGCQAGGCFGCCLHQKDVDTSAFEVERILDHAQRRGRLKTVVERAEALVAKGAGGACPLLTAAGHCSVYDIRPLACAAYHSLDRAACYSGPVAGIPSAESLWIEAMLIAGFGMVPEKEMVAGKPIAKHRLFEELAARGRARLNRRKAA